MLIQFTPAGGSAATLGDDANKYVVVIEQLGGESRVQIEPLYRAPNPLPLVRDNISGEFVFTSAKTYADYKTTFTQFKTEYARLNKQGSLVLTQDAVTLTFANAICRGVRRIWDAQRCGEHMGIRYTFAITTVA
jgi:hypothetical protein